MLSHPEMGPGFELATCSSGNLRSTIILLSAPVNISTLTHTDRSKKETRLKESPREACSLGNRNLRNKICREGHDKRALNVADCWPKHRPYGKGLVLKDDLVLLINTQVVSMLR